MNKLFLLPFFIAIIIHPVFAEDINVIPAPREVRLHGDFLEQWDACYEIDSAFSDDKTEIERQLNTLFFRPKGMDKLFTRKAPPLFVKIHKRRISEVPEAVRDQAYRITLKPDDVLIESGTLQGVMYACATLRQLRIKDKFSVIYPVCTVVDWPDTPIRGITINNDAWGRLNEEALIALIEMSASLKLNRIVYSAGSSLAQSLQKLQPYAESLFIELSQTDAPPPSLKGKMMIWPLDGKDSIIRDSHGKLETSDLVEVADFSNRAWNAGGICVQKAYMGIRKLLEGLPSGCKAVHVPELRWTLFEPQENQSEELKQRLIALNEETFKTIEKDFLDVAQSDFYPCNLSFVPTIQERCFALTRLYSHREQSVNVKIRFPAATVWINGQEFRRKPDSTEETVSVKLEKGFFFVLIHTIGNSGTRTKIRTQIDFPFGSVSSQVWTIADFTGNE